MIRLQRSTLKGLRSDQPSLPAMYAVLNQAIELEHATIPLYLYAMYSLDPTRNKAISDILFSVVMEEMLHMTLASNVLNALGGTPAIGGQYFVPTYPGPLPGGVEHGLTCNLAPFSPAQLDTFLDIEQPEDPLNFPTAQAFALDTSITIGEFYDAISTAIGVLGDGAFVNPPRNQVGPNLMQEAVIVHNVATAQQAIRTIVEQGEGTSTSPEEVVGDGFAHYYRFMQIKNGRTLVKNPSGNPAYSYSGEPISFDPSGVYAVPTNPKLANYPPGSAQRLASNNFNYTYTSLLSALNTLFNGTATSAQLNIAIGLMMSLKGQAKAMMSGIPNPAVLTGPSFEYQPVDPGSAAA
ncbi:ferritin-like protein [Cupriavidus necator]|uniref:ferritin-like domain-containing protein n=1 Tax=Cupriavidus necator TaxID=106590 RepID=UPI0039C19126